MSSIKPDHSGGEYGDSDFTGAQVDSVVKHEEEEMTISTGEERENPIPDLQAKLCQFDEEGNELKERGGGLDQFHTLMEQTSNSIEADNPAESSAKTLALEQRNKEEASTESQSFERNDREAADAGNTPVKVALSRKRIHKSLKAKSKIKKGPTGGSDKLPGLLEQENNYEGAGNPAEVSVQPLALEQSNGEAVETAMKTQLSEKNNGGDKNAGNTPVKAESVEKGTQQENNNKEAASPAEASAEPLDLEQRNKEAAMKSQSSEINSNRTEKAVIPSGDAKLPEDRAQHEDSSDEADASAQACAKPLASEQRKEESVETSMKLELSEMNNSGAAKAAEEPVDAEFSKKRTPKSLKAKAKIKKGSSGGSHNFNKLMEQEKDKEVDNLSEAFAHPSALEQRNKEDVAAATKSESSEMNNQGAENASETPVKPESSKRRTLESLKAKSKIRKRPPGEPNQFQRITEQENSSKESECLAEPSAKPFTSEPKNEEGVEATTKSHSSEMNIVGVENAEQKPVKAESSKKGAPKSLKAKSRIKKGSPRSFTLKEKRAEKAKDDRHLQGRNGEKDKSLCKGKSENNNKEFRNGKNQSSIKLEKNAATKEYSGEGQETRTNEERIAGSSNKSHCNQKREEKRGGLEKCSMNGRNKEKLDFKDKILGDQRKKEQLGGLIFMCNSKTKPDCFHYQVMGVSAGKKDIVLAVKPGLKLFLYDFDLKLMYGIYKASSSGGMKLEPKAFSGSFPAQVRFSVHKDCIPVHESVFKKAIKDNYDKTNKFDIRLSIRQVRKLSELFRSVPYQLVKPGAFHVHSAPVANIQDRGTHEKLRNSQLHSERELFTRANGERSYPVLSRERDQRIEHREVISTRREEEAPRDLYMGEKEYRMYGLQRGKRNLTPPRASTSTLDPYSRNLERDHLLRQPSLPYSDRVLVDRESVLADPIYSAQKEFQTNHVSGRNEVSSFSAVPPSSSTVAALDSYRRDPYYSYQYGSSSTISTDTYLLSARREEISPGSYYIDGRRESYLAKSDPLYRRESDSVEKLYLKYGVEPLSDYKQQVYQGAPKPETLPQSVSSRYSFAGPSLSHRN